MNRIFYKSLVITGSTETGKSVYLHNYIQSLIDNSEYHLVLIDPKSVEFYQYKDASNVTYVAGEITTFIKDELNKLLASLSDKYVVVVIDEYADITYDKDCVNVIEDNLGSTNVKFLIATQREDSVSKAIYDKVDGVLNLK